MNPTISADALVTAALWLLALGLPLAMLLWMAAQYVALRALGRRIAALEARAGDGSLAPAAAPPERLAEVHAAAAAPPLDTVAPTDTDAIEAAAVADAVTDAAVAPRAADDEVAS